MAPALVRDKGAVKLLVSCSLALRERSWRERKLESALVEAENSQRVESLSESIRMFWRVGSGSGREKLQGEDMGVNPEDSRSLWSSWV